MATVDSVGGSGGGGGGDGVFKKKARSRPTAQRKRHLEDDPTPAAFSNGSSEVVKVARPLANAAFVQGSAGLRRAKRARQSANGVASDSDDDDEAAHEVGVSFAARREEPRERSKSPSADDVLVGDEAVAKAEAGLYQGQKAYGSQLPKGSARYGPIKGPDNVRTITLTDYKPDICKDYKETGYCGFGDSCIFLHDRSDYMHGWQLDNMYLSQQAARNAAPIDEPEEDDIPFACYICRQEFTDPVVTRCGHYFCSACAIKRYAKNSKCAACNAATNGIFNRADKILDRAKKFKRLRERGDDGQEAVTSDGEAGLDGVEGLAEGDDPEAV